MKKIFVLLSLLFLTSCSINFPLLNSSSNNTSSTTERFTSNQETTSSEGNSHSEILSQIKLSQNKVTLYVNESIKVEAQLIPLNQMVEFVWSVKDNQIAEVNEGLITGKKEGNTTIYVSYNDLIGECELNVIKKNENINGEINLFAMNDFHGSIIENDEELGFLKQGTFFKNKSEEDNTLILNSGDMWQGSIESNSNYGEFLTKAMNYIEFDSFTLGNHEFDWGKQYIINNRSLFDQTTKYSTPFLGANIYNYDIESKTTLSHADDICEDYVIKDLENGLRVGIIGIIGENQITSISSQFADEFTFVDSLPIIKNLSDELRINKKCDVIILDGHASQEQISSEVTSTSSLSNKKYVDAVFCAHSHQYENVVINGVPFVQGASNGKSYSEIHLRVSNGNVSLISSSNHSNDNKEEIASITNYDTYLKDLYNEYVEKANVKGQEVLGYVNGFMSYSTNYNISVPKLVSKAMAQEAYNQGYEVDFAFTNQARSAIEQGNLTYANLYKSLPFDNEMIILEVNGSDIIRQSSKNTFYRACDKVVKSNGKYLIVVIDYLALHRNTNRNYNYFPSLNIIGKLTKNNVSIYNYRDMTADYIRKEKNIYTNQYSSYNERYSLLS